MVQDAGADDLIEGRPQLADPLNRQLMNLEVVQRVFAFELLGGLDARGAEVDASHLCGGPAKGMLRGL